MSMYKVIFVDDQNRITSAQDMSLHDPHPYMDGEARLQASTPDRANPERFGIDATPPAESIDGKWVNCKVVDYAVVPMTQEEIDARQAEKDAEEAQMEARRIAGLVELYGQMVGRLATFLDVFALKMPITKQAAITKIYGDSKADGKKNPDAMMLMSIYDELIGVMSNDDIYAVGKAIGVAV